MVEMPIILVAIILTFILTESQIIAGIYNRKIESEALKNFPHKILISKILHMLFFQKTLRNSLPYPKLLLFFQQNPVPPHPIIALFPYATPFTISLSNQKPINPIKTT
jgi:hypothetical protein